MSDFLLLLMGFIGVVAFVMSIIYMIASMRTKDKNAGYISIAFMIVSIISIAYLAF